MGRRGPRPLTKQLLQAHGSWRANLIRNGPEAPQGRPACPAWLDRDAKAAWRYTVYWLDVMKVLSKVDRNSLTRYCQAYSRWKKAELFLQKHGEMYPLKDDKGQVRCFMPWPQVAIAHKLGQTLTRLEQEFGLTPSARTRINPSVYRPQDARQREMDDFFSGGGPAPPRPGFERKSG